MSVQEKFLSLFPAYRAQKDTIDKISRDIQALIDKETNLYEISVRDGRLTAEMGGSACQVLAEQFYQLLKERGGENYLEVVFRPRVDDPDRFIVVTVRYERGKTPGQCRDELEKEVKALKAELDACNKNR